MPRIASKALPRRSAEFRQRRGGPRSLVPPGPDLIGKKFTVGKSTDQATSYYGCNAFLSG